MSSSNWVELQDESVTVSLESLASVKFTHPTLSPPKTFAIRGLLGLGDMSSIFLGDFENTPAILEVCTRIPYVLVCRELAILNELGYRGTLKVRGAMKNPSLGVITIAYEHFDFKNWTEDIPSDKLLKLLLNLLKILKNMHKKKIAHNWICRQSVYVSTDLETVKLGLFHAAARVGEPTPLVPRHQCAPPNRNEGDGRPDDIYSAALWYLSFIKSDKSELSVQNLDTIGLSEPVKQLIERMVVANPAERISADDAVKLLERIIE